MAVDSIVVEADEDVPNVVERLRQVPFEDVELVLPSRSRFAQSRFNFQLLRQYAIRLGKRVAIRSADPAVLRMAEESGFTVRAMPSGGPSAGPGAGVRPERSPRPVDRVRARPETAPVPGRAAAPGARSAAGLPGTPSARVPAFPPGGVRTDGAALSGPRLGDVFGRLAGRGR